MGMSDAAWDREVDLLVAGAGPGGMTAALVAALEGLDVLICEKSEQVGGTGATSAGTLWIPGNSQSREAGYDDDNENWFWAKYLPDGSLDKNPKGMELAGRVAKGADMGCIACHSAAPGDDYLYVNDRGD